MIWDLHQQPYFFELIHIKDKISVSDIIRKTAHEKKNQERSVRRLSPDYPDHRIVDSIYFS
jgi:predicted CopG family antitoxin